MKAILISAITTLVVFLILGFGKNSSTSAIQSQTDLPIGSIIMYGGDWVNLQYSGTWKLCDGKRLPASSFPELAAVLKSNWGKGYGEVYLPDLRGQFVRGAELSTDRDDGVERKRWNNGFNNNGNEQVGTYQDDELKTHYHNFGRHTHSISKHSHKYADIYIAESTDYPEQSYSIDTRLGSGKTDYRNNGQGYYVWDNTHESSGRIGYSSAIPYLDDTNKIIETTVENAAVNFFIRVK